jgi:hypothetical protein
VELWAECKNNKVQNNKIIFLKDKKVALTKSITWDNNKIMGDWHKIALMSIQKILLALALDEYRILFLLKFI